MSEPITWRRHPMNCWRASTETLDLVLRLQTFVENRASVTLEVRRTHAQWTYWDRVVSETLPKSSASWLVNDILFHPEKYLVEHVL